MNKNQWMNALVLWWGIFWRFILVMFALGVVIFSLVWLLSPESIVASNGQYSFNLNSSNSDLGLLPLLILVITGWMMGALGQHLLNQPYGNRKIIMAGRLMGQGKANWMDGFTLQWALFWRGLLIHFGLMLIMVMLGFPKEITTLADGSVVVNYGIQDPNLNTLMGLFIYIIASWHLLKKPFGNRVYSVELKSKEDSDKNL